MSSRKNNRNNNRRPAHNKTNVAICTDPRCNGSGIVDRREENCTDCNGTGRFVKKRQEPCRKCRNRKTPDPQCTACHGSGVFTRFLAVVECRRCKGSGKFTRPVKCKVCGHEGTARYRKKVKATVGTIGELWPTN